MLQSIFFKHVEDLFVCLSLDCVGGWRSELEVVRVGVSSAGLITMLVFRGGLFMRQVWHPRQTTLVLPPLLSGDCIEIVSDSRSRRKEAWCHRKGHWPW